MNVNRSAQIARILAVQKLTHAEAAHLLGDRIYDARRYLEQRRVRTEISVAKAAAERYRTGKITAADRRLVAEFALHFRRQ